jgi:hypothetical protein
VSSNQEKETRVSNIDIDGIFVKNFDPLVYQDAKKVAEERIELIA